MTDRPMPCPCGRPQPYAGCCGRYHAGEPAPDAESLMRSRYAAYALGLDNYVLSTWAPETRPATVADDGAPAPKWIGLTVKRHQATGPDRAVVEFVARCRIGGRAHKMHETSRFERREGRWYYVDGVPGS